MPEVASYNFDDVSEYFEFKLGGYDYQMRYPTTEELENASQLENEKRGDFVLSFIKGVKDETPPISETLKKTNVKSSRMFLKTIMKEFSAVE